MSITGFATGACCAGPRQLQRIVFRTVVAAALLLPFPLLAQAPATNAPDADSATESTSRPSNSASPTMDMESFDGGTLLKIGRTISQDELHIIKAPFQVGAIKWDILIAGATAALVVTDADERFLQDVPTRWHDRSIIISNAATYGPAAIAGGIYLAGKITRNEHEQEVGVRTAEAVVDSVILYGAMKAVFARQRPFTGTGEGQFFAGNWTNGSFPSGHSMFAWTIASAVAHQYHSLPLDILLYGLAATAGTTRITAREHFPSDVLVGSAFGYFIGDYVAHKPDSALGPHAGKFSRARDAVLEHVSIGVQ